MRGLVGPGVYREPTTCRAGTQRLKFPLRQDVTLLILSHGNLPRPTSLVHPTPGLGVSGAGQGHGVGLELKGSQMGRGCLFHPVVHGHPFGPSREKKAQDQGRRMFRPLRWLDRGRAGVTPGSTFREVVSSPSLQISEPAAAKGWL